jgi:hypothetical protein
MNKRKKVVESSVAGSDPHGSGIIFGSWIRIRIKVKRRKSEW